MKRVFLLLSLLVGLLFTSCTNNPDEIIPINIDCSTLDLSVVITDEICSKTIIVTATGGDANYTYSKDDGATFQLENSFLGLKAGTYSIVVKDGNGCEKKSATTILNDAGDLAFTFTTKDAGCETANGEVTITATGGDGTYTYSKDNITYNSSNVLIGFEQGIVMVYTKDGNNCVSEESIEIKAGNVSYATDVAPVIIASCGITGCHTSSNPSRLQITNYAIISANITRVIGKLNSNMPRFPGTILAIDREKVICWLNDGALNN